MDAVLSQAKEARWVIVGLAGVAGFWRQDWRTNYIVDYGVAEVRKISGV
jgi:hypothetical protein